MKVSAHLPMQFQQPLFEMVDKLVPVDGLRFHIYVPGDGGFKAEVGSCQDVINMTRAYTDEAWHCDPMHPSRFEDSSRVIVTNTQLMPDIHWKNSKIYLGFFQPHNFFHDADIFFRQQGRIFSVLTLLRRDMHRPFTQHEVELLTNLQPFVQFTLSQVYLPKRMHNRQSLVSDFDLTAREIDVVELALTGVSNKVLAAQLKISLPTLRTHLQNIYSKTNVHSTSELISKLMNSLN